MGVNRPFFAAVLVGAVTGASIMFTIQGRQIEGLRLQLHRIQQENADLENENTLLSRKLEQASPDHTIEGIEVEVQAPDELSQLEIQQIVKKQLSFLIGEPVRTLEKHPDLPSHVLDGKMFTVDKVNYVLHVNAVVVTSKLHVVVTAAAASTS